MVAHAVLANGGAIAPAGIHMVAQAARQHSTPLVVLVGLHKLSPLFPHDPDLQYNDVRGACRAGSKGYVGLGVMKVKSKCSLCLQGNSSTTVQGDCL